MSQTRVPIPLDKVQYRLSDVALALLLDEPFYGHVISGVNKKVIESDKMKEVSEIRSLGLSSVTLDISYKLWEPLTEEEQKNRLKHEMLHYIFLHPWDERPKSLGLYYMACDISVNLHVDDSQSMSASSWTNLCNKYGKSIDTSDGWVSIYQSLLEMYRHVPSQITDDKEIEKYVQQALKGDWFESDGVSLKESIFFLPPTTQGPLNVSGMMSMLDNMKKDGASDEEISDFIQSQADNPSDPWAGVQQGTSEFGAKNIIKNAMGDAKSRGDVPAGLSDYVDMLLAPPKINWKKELRQFTSTAGNVIAKTTMTRRSKRYGTFPSLKIKRTQRIAICCDTSGSVSDEEFKAFISELRGTLQNNCEVIFIQADAIVDQVDIYNKTLPELVRINRNGYGGTSFDDALLFVKTRGKLEHHDRFTRIGKVDGTIYFTDGYAPAPKKENLPMGKLMWLTTQKPVENMVSEGFPGKIVFLDMEE